jgi:hypothetical protein
MSINKPDNLLVSCNLTSIINFSTRVENTSAIAVYNICIDISQFESYTVTPVLYGLPDDNVQLLITVTDIFCTRLYKNLKPSGN